MVAVAGVVGALVAVPGFVLAPESGSYFQSGRNPYALAGGPGQALYITGLAVMLASLVAAAVSLVHRYRRSTGVERQQMKWFALAAAVAAIILPTGVVLWNTVPLIRVAVALSLAALPIAMCAAILRYRLYDIDIVISRTVVYGTLTGLLAGVYWTASLLVGAIGGQGSVWATAVVTLVAATGARPIRDRLQRAVDRRFDRDRHNAVRRVIDFLDDLRAGRAQPEDVELVLRKAIGAPDLRLFLRLPGSDDYVDLDGRPVIADGGDEPSPIRLGRVTIGALALGEQSDRARARLPELLEAGGLAIEIVRLRVELRRQLAEVAASRARLVAAADEERRRIERDLHDGLQQRLVSIGLSLRHAQHALGSTSTDAARLIERAMTELTVSIDDLRELARGLRPAQLDQGLTPALRELARRAPLPVEVHAPRARLPIQIESAAYFTACEGVTNAVKHSAATKISVSAERVGDHLVLAVRDDGIGGASARPGSGLSGLQDRVAAHGGTLAIDSPPGAGTILTAVFPCGS